MIDTLLTIAAATLAVPAATYCMQCVLGSLPWRRRPTPSPARPPRVAVVIPAHDESAGIAATVGGVLRQLDAGDRLVVVADNCADDTAARARAAAEASPSRARCTVVERADPERRGKGHALAFGRDLLTDDPPDVVVFVDADCRVVQGSVRELAAWAMATDRPVQADYVIDRANDSPLGALSAFAIRVRNRVRPRGLARLGLPCQITGSGMALPWSLTTLLDGLGGHLVEDLVLGLEAALAGRAPLCCPEVRVESRLPHADDDARTQRRRWEHGQLATALAYGPRLLLASVRRGSPALLALGLDLLVPPLALLVSLLLLVMAAATAHAVTNDAPIALCLAAGALVASVAGTLVAWSQHAREMLPRRQLLRIPLYLLWKLPLYFGFLRRREQVWRRTPRSTARLENEPQP